MPKPVKTVKLTMTPLQRKFVESPAYITLFGGAAGGGKSYGLLLKYFLYCQRNKGAKVLLLRRTFPELKRSLILTSLSMFPQELGKYNETDHVWKFSNGSRMEFGYCDQENDVYKYQSAEYDCIGFDEGTHFTQQQFLYLMSRNRSPDGREKKIDIATNPGGIGHGWVKQMFINGREPLKVYENEHGLTTIFIPARVQDNPYIMVNDPQYIKQLEQLPEAQRRALLDGDWDVYEGQYFTEFRRESHVINPITLQPYWKRFRSIDWGYNAPCAVYWHAVDGDNRVYTYREMYVTQKLASEVAREIVRLSKNDNVSYTVASPDMWAKRGNDYRHGESLAETFQKNGVHLTKADNNRVIGWQRVREYLSIAPDGKPWWQIFSNCTNLIRTIPEMIYDDTNPEDIDDKCEDHACLVAGTMVTTSTGDKPIENIMPGELVLTRYGYKKVLASGVTGEKENVMTVCFSDGRILTGTGNHPVWVTGKKFVRLDQLEQGDMVSTCSQNLDAVHAVGFCQAGTAKVYNLAVKDIHEYYANGILLHNCESARYGLMSRPRPLSEPEVELTGTYAYGELKLLGYSDGQIKRLRNKVKIIGGKKR